MKKLARRIIAGFLVLMLLLSLIPFNIFAAPASDIPSDMLDNVYLDALEYTGYDVTAQKNNGTIFKSFGSSAPASVRSDIGYGTTASGLETVNKNGTHTGKAPDIENFESKGLCCASYVTYVYYNYMVNIAGVDTSICPAPSNTKAAQSYNDAAVSWVNSGIAREITFKQDADGSDFVPTEEIPLGSLVVFQQINGGRISHVAIYAGQYDGNYFVTHVGNSRGPEISTIVGMSKGDSPQVVTRVVTPQFVEQNGKIEIYKKNTEGSKLSGACFVATASSDSSLSYEIGPTDSNGYAFVEGLPFDTYTVKETVFPTNYESNGVSEWTVTIDSKTTNGTVTINAVNKLIPGSCKIIKKSEDGKISDIDFTITGNGITKTVTTDKNGQIIIDDLKPGTYTVTEETIDKYEPTKSQDVTVVSGQTATVNFSNTLKRGTLTVTKTSEDGLVQGMQFKLTGTSLSGETVEMYAITNAYGIATFKDVLISGNVKYTLSEVNTPKRYEIPASQSVVVEWNETTKVSVYNKLKRGDLEITKTSEDGMVQGVKFQLTGTSLSGKTIDLIAITNANGIARFEDVLITGVSAYTVTEIDTKAYYIVPAAQSVYIDWNTVTNKSFHNKLKRGSLKVQKSSEDDFVKGMKFRLTGTSDSGIRVDKFATTDANGVALFEDILIGKNYVLSEVNTPSRYVVPATQNVNIEWDKVTNASVNNILKKWSAEVYKKDSITNSKGVTQGDATLEGALYGVYKNNVLVDSYKTDKSGYFITKYYPVGDNNKWTIKEISPSEGYILDPTVYQVDAYTEKYTVELNKEYLDVYEDIIRGKIAIIKHADDGSTQIEHPEENAVFEVYLKKSGTYKDAKETERALLTTDEYGFAETLNYLPYGVYVVKQIKGQDGTALMPAFDVNINENNKTYRYLINNAVFKAEIEIVKKDKETDEIIPASGIGFKVRNTDTGEFIVQHINYPVPMDIEIYYTNDSGKLMLPYAIPYGNYEIIEQNTCFGYVLDGTPVPFKVDGSNNTVTVVKSNIAQKGTITITKTGEIFSSVSEAEGIYQPIYEVKGLQGAVYEIVALEDIITPDGTVRYTQGQVVDTITTDKDGIATSKSIYLGKYQCKEVTAPYGMVINKTPVDVELVYAGELVEITTTSASFVNERQKIVIDLIKSMEQDDVFNIGAADEITNVKFGMYATEDMIAADGKIIPKDALIETAYCNVDGKIVFATDLPVGVKVYVKELNTDNHYLLNEDIFYVDFDYAGQETETVHTTVNNGETIENIILRGSIIGKKLDEDGFNICGALFGLFHSDATEFTEENAILTCESNEIGVFLFENVPYGKYIVREIKPAPAFVLNKSNYDVVIDDAGETVELVIENKFIVGSVQTIKVDKDYPENTLSGAVFEVYVDVDGNKEFDAEIDLLVGEMTEGENGIHTMENLRYNGYFLYEKTAPEGFLKDDGYYYFEIRVNGEVVTVENEAGVGFINEAIKGTVTTTKIDKEYPDNKLSGAVFEVYADTDKNGEFDADIDILIDELKETELGIYSVTELRYGGYFLYEKTAPVGFLKDDGYYYFEIRENDVVVTVENEAGIGFVNQPIKGGVTTTKIDKEYPDNKLTGAVFEVYGDNDKNGEFDAETDILFGELTEVETGVYSLAGLRFGGYFLYEKTAPIGFLKDDGYYYFEIKEDGRMVDVNNEAGVGFNNQPIIGSVKITKKDADTGEVLSDVEFAIYDKDGIEIAKGITDNKGELIFDNIRFGHYVIKEITPKEGYFENKDAITVEITEHEKTLVFEVTNKKIPPLVDIPSSPQTGDYSRPWIPFCLMLVSGITCVILSIKLSKRKEEE